MKSLRFGVSGSLPPVVFLHGIPGIRSRQNRDIAEKVALETGRDCRLALYAGLGFAPGAFSFRGSYDDAIAFVAEVLSEPGVSQIDIVGHSWGGFLSLVVCNCSKFPGRVRKLVLMSPLLEFQTARLSGPAFEMMARQNPELVLAESAVLDREFLEMAASDPVDRLIGGLPESLDVLLLQAEKDEITPASVMNAKLPLFVKRPQVEMIATDHSFVIGREVISARIARFLS